MKMYNLARLLPKSLLIARHQRLPLALFLTDIITMTITAVTVLLLRDLFGGSVNFDAHLALLPFLLLAPATSFATGLYHTVPLPPPCELKRLSMATTVAYLAVAIFIFFTRGPELYSRFGFASAWIGTLITVPLMRGILRKKVAHARAWFSPTLIFGPGSGTEALSLILRRSPELGLDPVAICTTKGGTPECPIDQQLPVLDENGIKEFAKGNPDAYALIILGAQDRDTERELTEHISRLFRYVILLPRFIEGSGNLWFSPVEFGGLSGFMVRQNLLDGRRLMVKRVLDVCATLAASVIILPVVLLIALAIRMDSPGPAFFHQRRLGFGGKHFNILKFRTMRANAEEVLQEHLANSPELRAEWDKDQKLRNDPRVTRVGNFLRKTSLDELPQLWNVLCGEMSLVGPRPIVDNEIERYGSEFETYTRVRPGITGLWQISGRNDTLYTERVRLDRCYICNWSVWFDIWIIARTIPVVIYRRGAY